MNLRNFPKRLDSKTSCLRITVPENLDLALEGLIRKVLREQPRTDDIHAFAADYFETLLRIRDKAGARYAQAQLCPFHNDEDADEMIKMAGSFGRRGEGRGEAEGRKGRSEKGERGRRRAKVRAERSGELSKQMTPDLIKKLPRVGVERGKDGEGVLGGDPIKELVEKELMMEASKEKTSGAEGLDGGGEEKDKTKLNEEADETIEDKENKKKTEPKEEENKPVEERENEMKTEVNKEEKLVEDRKDDVKPEVTEEANNQLEDKEDEVKTELKEETTKPVEEKEETEVKEEENKPVEDDELKTELKKEANKVVEENAEGEVKVEEKEEENKPGEEEKGEATQAKATSDNEKSEVDEETISEDTEEKVTPNTKEEEERHPETPKTEETEAEVKSDESEKDKIEVKTPEVETATAMVNPSAILQETSETDKEEQNEKEVLSDTTNTEMENCENERETKTEEESQPEIDPKTIAEDEKAKEVEERAEDDKEEEGNGDKDMESESALETGTNAALPLLEKADDQETEEGKETEIAVTTEKTEDSEREEIKPEDEESQRTVDVPNDDVIKEKTEKPETEEAVNVIDDSANEEGATRATEEGETVQNDQRSVSKNVIDDGITEKATEEEKLLDVKTENSESEGLDVLKEAAEEEEVTLPEESTEDAAKELPEPTEDLSPVEGIPAPEEEELCTVVDIQQIPKPEKSTEEAHEKEEELCVVVDSEHVIRVEEAETGSDSSRPSEEVQIKTIQTHYYDTLKVPETVTRELRVRSVGDAPSPPPLDVASGVESAEGEADTAGETEPETGQAENPEREPNLPELGLDSQRSETDDLLDLMTPTSGYSLNLSELSWQTISGMFLDSERQYSGLDREDVCLSGGVRKGGEERAEVEEVFHKTEVPSRVDAVPLPPRDVEEILREEGVEEVSEKVKKAGEEETGEESEGGGESGGSCEEGMSSNGKGSIESDVPVVSVEVKTVIESEVGEEEEEEGSLPQVEVEVEVQVGGEEEEERKGEEGKEASNGEGGGRGGRAGGVSGEGSGEGTGGGGGSSGESESTISSAATEIKRSEFGRRNVAAGRGLLASQSLDKQTDLGGRNPLLRTRSLSTFRHGVTDFEVWNAIEKELEEAATKIQSRFRRYKTRKKLQRENAVQITTEESSPSTTPAEADQRQHSTGEFHDSIVLSEHPR